MGNAVSDWSQAFDVLWNNIMSNKAPGINNYEKGIFLTQAQVEVAKDYLSANSNILKEGVDDSARRQADFVNLIRVANSFPTAGTFLCIISEVATNAGVVPLSGQEYQRVMSKPYHNPPKGQVWRVWDNNGGASYIPTTASVTVTYVATPPDMDLTGSSNSVCSLPKHLWDEVLIRAVNLAKIAWTDVASNN